MIRSLEIDSIYTNVAIRPASRNIFNRCVPFVPFMLPTTISGSFTYKVTAKEQPRMFSNRQIGVCPTTLYAVLLCAFGVNFSKSKQLAFICRQCNEFYSFIDGEILRMRVLISDRFRWCLIRWDGFFRLMLSDNTGWNCDTRSYRLGGAS